MDENQPDRFTAVLQQLIRDLRKRRADEQINQLEEALKERGFLVSDDQKVRPADILVDEDQGASDYLDELISRNQKCLTRDVIVHHLEQHWNLYSEGTSPGAATNEARQVIEQILEDIESELEPLNDAESGTVIDLFLSYRAVSAWPEMIALVDKMSPPLAAAVMVQEQLALALNRGEVAKKQSGFLSPSWLIVVQAARPTASWAAFTKTGGLQRYRMAKHT